MLSDYFQLGPIPTGEVYGTYDLRLVFLSYIVATFASYIALDMAGRLRDENNTRIISLCWLFGGSFAMGAGIWSMHFIGMLAFTMKDMPMTYNIIWTLVSMLVAIFASFIALSLLRGQNISRFKLVIGGIIMGIAIAAMHYIGMYAMTDSMIIRYFPGLYFLSILIAILAAEAALWLAIKSNQGILRVKIRLKIISALIMGAAICGMHYTGMAAAVFFPKPNMMHLATSFDPNMLSITVAVVTFLILGIAFALSTYKEIWNQQMINTARLAGMAEVSSNVLHSVGNVLNSLNVSSTFAAERIEHAKISELKDLSDLFQKHKNNLSAFFSDQKVSADITDFIQALSEYWQKEQAEILNELSTVQINIQNIRDIISTQQSLGDFYMFDRVVDIQSVINEAITMTGVSLAAHAIQIKKEFSPVKPFLLDKIKLLQILANLLRNAKDSLLISGNEEKIILIKLSCNDKTVCVEVIDNGEGIKEEDIKHIFTHGFTTKKTGHGFGLHTSAIFAKQMGGSLTAKSNGLKHGAIFTLSLPYRGQEQILNKIIPST